MSAKKKKVNLDDDAIIVSEDLEINGSIYATTLPAKYKDRAPYKPQNPNQVLAFMPGTVRKFFVSEGDTVAKGDKLLVLDAMKMNNELLAPVEGTVSKIEVKIGESVPKHKVLMTLQPLSDTKSSAATAGKPAKK